MDFRDVYRTLEKNRYFVFSHDDLLLFYPKYRKEHLKKLLHRWKRQGWIHSLKRGLYELSYPRDFAIPDLYVANRLYEPSYCSLETALSHYSIIPEISMAVTSITTKPTRKFRNEHGLFVYHTVKPDAFAGYCIEKHQGFEIRIAEPEKALTDYLYFRVQQSRQVRLEDVRLDIDLVRRMNKRKLNRYAGWYNMDWGKCYGHIRDLD